MICEIPLEGCGRSRFWNYESCTCEVGCDFIRDCKDGQKWDIFKCDCFEGCPSGLCSKGFTAVGENCDCVLNTDDCVESTTEPSTSTTHEICRNRYVWLEEIGECVCPPMYCPEGTIRGNDCDCIPVMITDSTAPQCDEIACKRGYVWFPDPICQCFLACDYIMECEKGQKWDFIECGCVTDTSITTCPPTECPGSSILNQDTCNCECSLSDNDCSGPLAYLDYDFCECRRHPCDPPWPCPEGEIIDWNICNCAPDPNYTTTQKCSKSSGSSESYERKKKKHGKDSKNSSQDRSSSEHSKN